MQLPNTDRLHTAICNTGGATINPRTGEFVTTGGIVVAVPGYEKVIPARDFDHDALEAYAASIPYVTAFNPERMLGVWIDRTPRVYLDVVEVITDRPRALGLAKQRGEQAVYDLDAGETIYV